MLEIGEEWILHTGVMRFKETTEPADIEVSPDTLSIYAKDNGSGVSALYYKDDAGNEKDLSGGLTGSGAANRLTYWSGVTTLAANAALTQNHILVADVNGLPTGNASAQITNLTGDVALILKGTNNGFVKVDGSATGNPYIEWAQNSTFKARAQYLDADDSLALSVNGAERFRFGSAGQLGIGGATYGTSGYLFKSGGPSAAPTWTAPANVTAGSSKISLGGTPTGASLIAFSIDVNQANLDHGSIGGLTDDDHTGYARLTGRSGGQTLQGGTASGDDLTLNSTANATKGTIFFGASSAYDEVNGRLGIGITTPEQMVHIQKDTESAIDVGILADSYNDSDNMVNFFAVRRRLGTIGAQTALTSGKTLGVFYFQGSNGTNESTGIANGASIDGISSGTWTSTSSPASLRFNTTPSGSVTLTEAMRILSSGFVGIGTATPAAPLDVNKTVTNNTVSHSMCLVGGTLNGNAGGAGNEMFGFWPTVSFEPSSSIGLAAAFRTDCTASPPTGVTIASYMGGRYVVYTGSSAGAVTSVTGLDLVPVYGSIKPTNSFGLSIQNFGSASITTSYALSLSKPTGSTNNYYMYLDTADATDPTGGGGAAAGRIAIVVAGVARYIAYY